MSISDPSLFNKCKMVNHNKASIRLGHVLGSLSGKEAGDVMLSANFEFTLVTGAEETPELHRERGIMRGIDGTHKRLKECACSDDWLGLLECAVTSHKNTYKTTIRVEHGRGSSTGQEPGDLMMSVDHEPEFTLVTTLDETPDTHREQAVRVIDELYKSLEECTCAPDF